MAGESSITYILNSHFTSPFEGETGRDVPVPPAPDVPLVSARPSKGESSTRVGKQQNSIFRGKILTPLPSHKLYI